MTLVPQMHVTWKSNAVLCPLRLVLTPSSKKKCLFVINLWSVWNCCHSSGGFWPQFNKNMYQTDDVSLCKATGGSFPEIIWPVAYYSIGQVVQNLNMWPSPVTWCQDQCWPKTHSQTLLTTHIYKHLSLMAHFRLRLLPLIDCSHTVMVDKINFMQW